MCFPEDANCSKGNDGPSSDMRMLPQACLWARVSTASSYQYSLRQGALGSCSSSLDKCIANLVQSFCSGTWDLWRKAESLFGQVLKLLVERALWEQHTGSAASADSWAAPCR